MLGKMMPRLYLLVAALLAGCNPTIYVRDGVTDGDTFYLAPRAFTESDAVMRSWVTYSLMRSACQLKVGGEIPSRVSTYDCELNAREYLVAEWMENRVSGEPREDPYLDTLVSVSDAGFLEEYVVHYLGKESWQIPAGVEMVPFGEWRRARLRGHAPETRWIGSWGYGGASSVAAAGAGAE